MSFIRDKNYAKEICQAGKEKQCAYLGVTGNGYECWKESNLKRQIDAKLHDKLMTATGNNCVGMDRIIAEKNKIKTI